MLYDPINITVDDRSSSVVKDKLVFYGCHVQLLSHGLYRASVVNGRRPFIGNPAPVLKCHMSVLRFYIHVARHRLRTYIKYKTLTFRVVTFGSKKTNAMKVN